MTNPTAVAPDSAPTRAARRARPAWIGTLSHVAARWILLAALTVTAFWETLSTLVTSTRLGGLNGFIWTVPLAAVLAAVGVARRNRTELPIHDRQTDVIVGFMGLILALLSDVVLEPRYAGYFDLLRIDVIALWVFVFSGSIVLFGLRPVSRFAWVWAMLVLIFPFPYHLVVIVMGGSNVAAGAASLIIAGVATAIAVGRTRSRGLEGFVAAVTVGAVVLTAMAMVTPDAPLLAYQNVPTLTAICVAGTTMFVRARRGAPKKLWDRSIAPVAARQVWAGIPVLIAVTATLMLVRSPTADSLKPVRVPGLNVQGPLAAPPDWRTAQVQTFDWVRRLYGSDGALTRQTLVAKTGNPKWDKFSRPRVVVMDVVRTERPESLGVYPAVLLYDVPALRLSTPVDVDLGYGVTGRLYSAVDDDLLVTWDALQWTWSDGRGGAQRVLAVAVDNHEDDAPFPAPTGALLPTLATMLTVLLRGNAATTDLAPEFKDGPMLRELGRGLVRTALDPLDVHP